MRSGNCCSRMRYQEFPSAKGLDGILPKRAQNGGKGKNPIIKSNKVCINKCNKNPLLSGSRKKKEIEKMKKSSVESANFCIDLMVPDEARWRICHKSQGAC